MKTLETPIGSVVIAENEIENHVLRQLFNNLNDLARERVLAVDGRKTDTWLVSIDRETTQDEQGRFAVLADPLHPGSELQPYDLLDPENRGLRGWLTPIMDYHGDIRFDLVAR